MRHVELYAYIFRIQPDVCSRYNQIRMLSLNEEKTKLMSDMTKNCYKLMSFDLMNISATYQRLIDKILQPLARTIMQADMDHMVVTSRKSERHHSDLEQLFMTIGKYNLKFNPEKCVFGVTCLCTCI